MEQVIDEIADTYIMLEQLEIILEERNPVGFNVNVLIQQKMDEKLRRLEGMLNEK